MKDKYEDERYLLPSEGCENGGKKNCFVLGTPVVKKGVHPIAKVLIIVLFFAVLSMPLAMYFHCVKMVDQRTSLMREFSNFAFPTLKDREYANKDSSSLLELKLWLFALSQKVSERNFWYDYEETTGSIEDYTYEDEPPEINRGVDNSVWDFKTPMKENGNPKCDSISDSWRFDCHPETGASQKACEVRGCCWAIPKQSQINAGGIGVPYCFYPKDYPTYRVLNYTKSPNHVTTFLQRDAPSYYGNDVMLLRADAILSNTVIHTKIYDPLNARYEVPIKYPGLELDTSSINNDVEVVVEEPSTFKIIRKSTGQVIFDPLSLGALIFTDQFIQLSSLLPSKYVYGLGERRDTFQSSVDWKKYTMFASDQSPRDNSNLYGSHPFLLTLDESGRASGGFILNSNAMDVILQPAPAITYRIIGGVLDTYSFLGPTPSDIISQYTQVIGRPILPPYWSLGFHLCRFNYGTANKTRLVWKRTRDAGIPFDVQWNDIDYMDNRRDFSYDLVKFAELPQLVEDIHKAGMHYVPIIDPAIDVTDTPGTYLPYDDGIRQGIFINGSDGKPFVGKVWSPHGAVWPDFTNPKTQVYWTDQLSKYHKKVPFDGLWIDMNEPSNFYDGTTAGCPESSYENPPYLPGVNGGKLAHKTVCMTAKQHASIHYNVHNLYGFTETINTNVALKAIRNKRPFIVSRSTFPGQGHYGSHWTGDIFSTWDDMKKSIPAILDFNLFGIPHVGADICGFNGNTTVKLCQRWMELGAFYPFSRNHNTDDSFDQDPVALGPDVVRASVNALTIRYMLLPYLYTLFYRANQFGETVARPLFFEFPQDKSTYGIDTQFLWGSGLMILPALEEDVTTINAYFPAGKWYLFSTFHPIVSKGETVPLFTPLDTINVAFRGGNILPFQAVGNTTMDSRKNSFGLIVALDANYSAAGQLYWDDGDSLETVESGAYNILNFKANKGTVVSTIEKADYKGEAMNLGLVMAMGVDKQPTQVTANQQSYPFQYLQAIEVLIVYNMSIPMLDGPIEVNWK